MRLLALLVVLVALAAGAGWGAIAADAAPTPAAAAAVRTTTPVLSVRRAPESLLDTRRDQSVAAVVAPVAARIPGAACLVVTDGGRELFVREPDAALTPASTQKILVGAALLSLMGPDETFATTVVAAAAPVDGVVSGDVYVVGGGDPLLSTEAYIARQRDPDKPTTSIAALADALSAAGVTEIRGDVVGDGSRYDEVRDVPTWPQRYRDQVQAGPLSGLLVDDGLVTFTEEEVAAYGGTPATDPPAHAAEVVLGLLRERGITVTGGSRAGVAPDGAVELAAIRSAPASEVVGQMLRYSDNTTAELLVKEIAVRSGREGSTAAGLASLDAALAEHGIPPEAIELTDGSGLDTGNRATCRAIVQSLEIDSLEEPLVDGLAVAGESGTLSGRMIDTPAAGNLRAKTGSLRHVSALAGVVDAANGRSYSFAYIANVAEGELIPAVDAEVQEELAVALATLAPVAPPPEILPTPALTGG